VREGEGRHFFDIRSGREGTLGAGEDNGVDFGVGFKFEEGSIEFVDERGVEGVECFEAVECYCVWVSMCPAEESSALSLTLADSWSGFCDFYILIRPGNKSVRSP
jgi:hypothetical protein